MALNLSPSTSVYGNNSVRTFNINGLTHGAEPISQLIPLSIYDLEAGKVKRFSMKDDINFDLQVVSFRADIKNDDGSVLQDGNQPPVQTFAQAIVHVLEQEKVTENLNFWFTSYPSGISNHIVFDHSKDFEIRVNRDVNRLIFFCKPVYLLDGIDIFVPNKNDDTNSNNSVR